MLMNGLRGLLTEYANTRTAVEDLTFVSISTQCPDVGET